jgi:hypothetical protein
VRGGNGLSWCAIAIFARHGGKLCISAFKAPKQSPEHSGDFGFEKVRHGGYGYTQKLFIKQGSIPQAGFLP